MRTVALGITRTGIYRRIQPPPLVIVVAAIAFGEVVTAAGTAVAMVVAAIADNW